MTSKQYCKCGCVGVNRQDGIYICVSCRKPHAPKSSDERANRPEYQLLREAYEKAQAALDAHLRKYAGVCQEQMRLSDEMRRTYKAASDYLYKQEPAT